jgi:hypothetical protein
LKKWVTVLQRIRNRQTREFELMIAPGDVEAKLSELTLLEKTALSKSGEIDFSHRGIASFKQIKIPPIAKKLVLSNNNITNFIGFDPTPMLETIILDGNPLVSFLGFPKIHSIKHLSAQHTPLSELPNFTSLAILCLDSGSRETVNGVSSYDQSVGLETLNGRQITISDRSIVSGRTLVNQWVSRDKGLSKRIEPSVRSVTLVTERLGDMLRRGWISDTLPRCLDAAEEGSYRMEHDPISVQVVRTLSMLQSKCWCVEDIFQRLLGPPPRKVPAEIFVGDDWTERSEKQQKMIAYLTSQLDDLKQTQREELAAARVMKKKVEKAELSESTLNQYKHLLADAAPDLVANSRAIGPAEPEKKQRTNHLGLRKAVAKFLGCDPSVGDRELAERLAEQEAPPADARA